MFRVFKGFSDSFGQIKGWLAVFQIWATPANQPTDFNFHKRQAINFNLVNLV